jgi:hypothetical protein
MNSIIQEDTSICYECGRPADHIHHCLYGTSNRRWAEEYHLVVGLCYNHHTGQMGVHHGNKELDMKLKRTAQRAFEQTYPDLDFLAIFGRNYL